MLIHRAVAAQHADQVPGDAHRQHHRDLRAQADELDVADGAQATEQPVQFVVGQGERVAAREQHVADFFVTGDVVEGSLPLAQVEGVLAGVPHGPRAGAVAAVGGAEPGGQEEDAVRVAVDEARHRAVVVFAERVVVFAGQADELVAHRDVGATQGLHRILPAHQARVVGRDSHRQRAAAGNHGAAFVGGQLEDSLEAGQVADAVTALPAPVAPVGRRRFGKDTAAEAVRADRCRGDSSGNRRIGERRRRL
jgi:hypothetical protein